VPVTLVGLLLPLHGVLNGLAMFGKLDLRSHEAATAVDGFPTFKGCLREHQAKGPQVLNIRVLGIKQSVSHVIQVVKQNMQPIRQP
jgi:hypothetical protein